MPDEATLSPDSLPPDTFHQRYAPSWVDRLIDRVERLPGSPWLVYVIVWMVLLLIDGILRFLSTATLQLPTPFVLVFYGFIPYSLGLIHWLDRQASSALHKFLPALECDEVRYRELHYALTTMPAQPVWILTAIGIASGVVYLSLMSIESQAALMGYDMNRPGPALQLQFVFGQIATMLVLVVSAKVLFHTWHQLRLVSHVYRTHTRVDLLRQQPLYVFSNLSAATAIGILFVTFAWTFSSPLVLANPLMVIWAVMFSAICLLTFIAPLTGIHGLLKDNKSTRLSEVSLQFDQVTTQLHEHIKNGRSADADGVLKALQGLELEYQFIRRIPTWPWSPEVLRTVVAALFFPLVLYLIQWVLGRLLNQ